MILVADCCSQVPRWRDRPPERFLIGDVTFRGGRIDPHPLWVSVAWQPDVDSFFLSIQRETAYDRSLQQDSDTRGEWRTRALVAYKEWLRDHQNPERLFRAASLMLAAGFLDTKFTEAKDYVKMEADVNYGFSVLRPENVPPSYTFVRVAYIVNAGDSHYHYFKDVAERLLKRDPLDRGVLIAMVREYQQRGKDPRFEKLMFDGLFSISKTERWKHWDDVWIARAMRHCGIYYKSKSYFDKALLYMDKAIAKTPKGKSPKPLIEERALYLRERDLPNFGRPVFRKKGAG